MSFRSRFTPDRAVLIGLFLTAAAYCRDLKYDFLLDDVQLILMNQATVSWQNLKIIFTKDAFFALGPGVPIAITSIHYRPVFMLWLMLNQQLFGSVLPWWHLSSLLLHISVIFLVYKLGMKLLKDQWAACLAALLFAFHPIHVESVSYVSASTDLLVTVFLLLSFFSYSRFREQSASPGYIVFAVFAAALAMLSKETAAMFPWILVAYEALREIPSGTSRRWTRFVWTLPFFAVVGTYVLIRSLLFGHNIGPGPGSSRLAALADIPLVLVTYLRNLFWSFRLSFFYPVEWSSQWTVLKGFAVVLVLVAATLLWKHFRDRPNVRMQLVWTAILFVPPLLGVTAFVKEGWIQDRHMYLVSVPFSLLIAALLTDPKFPRKASVIASSLVLLVLLAETTVQVPRFSDGINIYESALRVAPGNALAHRYFAFALCGYAQYERCYQEFRIAANIGPREPTIHGSFADALDGQDRDEEAAAEYAKALDLAPRPTPYRAYMLYRLALIELKYSKSAEGESHLREAVQLDPQIASYHAGLAQALRQQGHMHEADQEMQLEANARKGSVLGDHANLK